MNAKFTLAALLILFCTTVFARTLPTEPYSLTEEDLSAIIRAAQELGVDTSKSLREHNIWQTAKTYTGPLLIGASFEIESNPLINNAERVTTLMCNRRIETNWSCRLHFHWLLPVDERREIKITAPADFEEFHQTYFEVVEFVVKQVGLQMSEGQISRIEKEGHSYHVFYGPTSGCARFVEVKPKVIDFEVVWHIDPYRSFTRCR